MMIAVFLCLFPIIYSNFYCYLHLRDLTLEKRLSGVIEGYINQQRIIAMTSNGRHYMIRVI